MLCQDGSLFLQVIQNTWFCFINWSSDNLGSSMPWLNVAPPPLWPHSYVEATTRSVMELICGALGRRLGHKGRALMNGVNALLKETWKSLFPFSNCEDEVRRQSSVNQEPSSHPIQNLLAPWSWTSQPPEWEINVRCIYTAIQWYFCDSSLDRLRHSMKGSLSEEFLYYAWVIFSCLMSRVYWLHI